MKSARTISFCAAAGSSQFILKRAFGEIQIIGAGLSRTGTTSLSIALDTLGYRVFHAGSQFSDNAWLRQMWRSSWQYNEARSHLYGMISEDGFNATVDEPISSDFLHLLRYSPTAKVILSVRDTADKWYTALSTSLSAWNASRRSRSREFHDFWLAVYKLNGCYPEDRKIGSDEVHKRCVERYLRHIATVQAAVQPTQILVYNVREGWPRLCEFLHVPVPHMPFPYCFNAVSCTAADESSKAYKRLRSKSLSQVAV